MLIGGKRVIELLRSEAATGQKALMDAGGKACAKRASVAGYTLMELTVVLALVAAAAQGYYYWRAQWLDEAAVERTVEAIARIDEALIAHRLDAGAWPATVGALTAYLPHFEPVNGVGLPFTIRASGTSLILETEMENERQRTALVNSFPANGAAAGDPLGTCDPPPGCEFELGVGIPGLETSHAALFLQDGSEPFGGTLDMDGNSIEDVGAVVFSGSATVGGSCTTGSIAPTSGGNLLECFGGTWRPAGTQVARVSGTASSGSTVSPPSGFSVSDCNISVSGAPLDYNHDTHKGWRHFSTYSSAGGSGWTVRAGVYVKTSGSEFSTTASGSVQYQIICVD